MSMGMIGESNHGLDAKGRLIIPIRFRQELGDKFVLCNGMDHNIDVYRKQSGQNSQRSLLHCQRVISRQDVFVISTKDLRLSVRWIVSIVL